MPDGSKRICGLSPLLFEARTGHAYEDLRRIIRRALRRHRAPASAVDDLEQDVIVALLRMEAPPRRARLSTWIWAVCRNAAIDYREREWARSTTSSEDAAALLATFGSPDEELSAADVQSQLYGVLWRLPSTSRHVVFLREIEGASYAAIAEALVITEEAARSAHYRGMARARSTCHRASSR